MEKIPEIHFNYNWNKKLYNHYFTTIRLDSMKWQIGGTYRIFLKDKYIYEGVVRDVVTCKIEELPKYICYIDTGYNKPDTINLLKKMCSNKNIDWEKQLLAVVLVEQLTWDKPA